MNIKKILPIALIGSGLIGLFVYLTGKAEAGEFPCPHCTQTFSSLEELNAHIASAHPGQSPIEPIEPIDAEEHICPICGAKMHPIITTAGIIGYRCPNEKWCAKENNYVHDWSKERCEILKQYKCGVCGVTFATQEECMAHKKDKNHLPNVPCAVLK